MSVLSGAKLQNKHELPRIKHELFKNKFDEKFVFNSWKFVLNQKSRE